MKNLIKKLIGRDRTAQQEAGKNEGGDLPPLKFANASVQLIVHNAAIREHKAHRNFLANCMDPSAAENWHIERSNLHRTENWASQRAQQKDRPATGKVASF
jgi:hypothetical protein